MKTTDNYKESNKKRTNFGGNNNYYNSVSYMDFSLFRLSR